MHFVLHFAGRPGCLPFAITVTDAPEEDAEESMDFARRVIEAGVTKPDIYGRITWHEIERASAEGEIQRQSSTATSCKPPHSQNRPK